jgi:lycopene beta-cyclase
VDADADLILVGGGLANCLIASRLRALRPELRLLVVERGPTLGGNHTWSFHGSDISPEQLKWLEPFIETSWQGHEILFPDRERSLPGSYHTIFSERVDQRVSAALGDSIMTGMEVSAVDADRVQLSDGRVLRAPAIIDGRGDPGSRDLDVRFQKFFGMVVELAEPCGLERPILMDARLPQEDGFRFMYSLPFTPTRLLIEDTRYSDTPTLDIEPMRAAIHAYAEQRNWRIVDVLREEQGALPVVLDGDLAAFWRGAPGVPRSGIRAGLFHYTTGYSLPEAVRLADDLALEQDLNSRALYKLIRKRSFRLWRRGRYFRLLNRMLYLGSPPDVRYVMLEYFYRLPTKTIDRFYAGALTRMDKLRIVTGKPPIEVPRAIRSLLNIPTVDNPS